MTSILSIQLILDHVGLILIATLRFIFIITNQIDKFGKYVFKV